MVFLINPFRFGSAPAFSPADIASLQLWIDPSDTATTTKSGGRFTAITDKEASNDLAPITGVNDPYVGTLNGLDSYDCRSDGALSFGDAAVFDRGNGAFTIAAAFVLDSTLAAAVTTFASLFRKIGAAGFGIDYQNSGANLDRLRFFCFLNSTVYDVGTTGVTKDTVHTIVASRLTGSADIAMWIDGSLIGTTPTVAPAGGIDNTSHAILGAANLAASTARLPWCGELGDFLFFNADLSSTDRANLESYLIAKWT
jgi:hypothetical protein